jgi:HK97 family phage major capsid protein
MREITLTPHEVAGHIVVTDKLLRNWEAAGTLIGTQLRNAILYAEETAFIGGTGAGQPQGITASPAAININRAVANQIAIGDVDNMYRRILERGGRYVWVGSPTIKGQLLAMADAGSHRAWMPNQLGGIQGGMPATLYGIPLYFYERMPGLGSKGDLMLLDLSYYLIKDGAGPFVGVSEHVYFTSNKTVFKAFWSVDGQSWLNEPIAVEGSTTNTLSPFVVLDVP